MVNRAKSRAERLRNMEMLYLERTYTDQEMANRLGVARSTVWKDRQALSEDVVIVDDGNGRYRIEGKNHMLALRLNLYEALTLYLAARRASRQTQMAGRHAALALQKLAAALKQPMTQRLVNAAHGVPAMETPADGTRVLETLARGWVEHITVRVHYRAFGAETAKVHEIRPYLIEPSQWSDSVYLIGHSNRAKGVTVLKTERIERASLTTEKFTLPDDFDDAQLLRHAWGIWYTAQEPVEICLRFTPGRVTQRVKESIWHPLQRLTDTADGGCEWRCEVDEWHEMLPWVRSWGADCEVLAPAELRAELAAEALKLMDVYR